MCEYSTVMQIIVVVVGVKFQMLIAVTNWFQMKSIANLLKCAKSTRHVRKIQHSGVSRGKYSTWLRLVLYLPLDTHPCAVFPVHTRGSALTIP